MQKCHQKWTIITLSGFFFVCLFVFCFFFFSSLFLNFSFAIPSSMHVRQCAGYKVCMDRRVRQGLKLDLVLMEFVFYEKYIFDDIFL